MSETASPSNETAFLHAAPAAGMLFDFRADRHSTAVFGWNESRLETGCGAAHFGFVGRNTATLTCDSGQFQLKRGMYFAVTGAASIDGDGCGFVASLAEYSGLFQIGGPVERTGRLRYIDGCSDTLLIAPAMFGDPCLNLLYIPPGTKQTAHTHPSLRVGMVLDGEGLCRTPDGDFPLRPELVFVIRSGGLHSFQTTAHPLRIVAWHPDSDCGPTDEKHPMLNRTLVSGRSVNAAGGRP